MTRAPTTLSHAALMVVAALAAIFLVAPSLVVIVMSFSSGRLMTFPPPGFDLTWYGNFFASAKWTSSTVNSVQIALLSTLFATILGTLAAFGLVRGKLRSEPVLAGLLLSPLIVPVVITGLGIFITYRSLGVPPFPGLIAAHTVLGMPYVFVTVWAALQDLDPDYEMAAANLGASPFTGFIRVTLPLLMPSILIGAIFAFVSSWDEVVVALFLSTPQMRTLPVTMWEEAKHSVDPTIAAASSLLTALTFVILVLLPILKRRASAVDGRRKGSL